MRWALLEKFLFPHAVQWALLEDCVAFYEKTGRRITFEYVLLAGVNDSDAHVGVDGVGHFCYRRRALPPRSRVVSGRPWSGNYYNILN